MTEPATTTADEPSTATTAEPVYRLRGVRYVYPGKHVALDGIDLDIRRGEMVCLLGANGSGKSTLLKLLDGIVGPSDGEMRALGRDVAAVAAGQDAFRFHRTRTSSCSARPSSTTSRSDRSSSA